MAEAQAYQRRDGPPGVRDPRKRVAPITRAPSHMHLTHTQMEDHTRGRQISTQSGDTTTKGHQPPPPLGSQLLLKVNKT